MNNNINVKITFKRILVYTPGTYKLSFHIKCQDKLLDFNCQPDFNFEHFQNGWFQMHPWQQLELVNDGIALVDNNVTVDIDKGLHSSAIFLHVHLLRYDENKATSSQNEGFSVFATGKLLLERSASLFSSGTEEDQEIHHTLQLFSTFIDEQTQIARGWIKYSMFVTTMKHKSTPCTPTNLIEVKSIDTNVPEIKEDVEKTDQMEQIPDEQEDEKVFDEHEKNIYIRRKTMESSLPDMKFEIDLPDKNAIQLMLPKFHALTTQKHFEPNVRPHIPIVEPAGESVEGVAKDDVVPTALSPRFKENLDGHVIAVLDYQAKELERYRNVVQRMGEDVVSLRRQITVLKHEKSQLTTKLYYSDGDVTNDGHLGVLKQSLAAEHQEKIALQERVYKLQDDIIKKNEMEASYLELQAAHEITKKNIQTLQDRLSKVKLLETTCQKQEKVIEALEKQTEFKKKSEASEDRLKKKKQTKFPAQLIDKDDVNFYDIHEKLRLIERIEQAESTIRALEEQLQVNANQWARDRALLQQRDDNMLLMRAHNFDPTPALKYVQPIIQAANMYCI